MIETESILTAIKPLWNARIELEKCIESIGATIIHCHDRTSVSHDSIGIALACKRHGVLCHVSALFVPHGEHNVQYAAYRPAYGDSWPPRYPEQETLESLAKLVKQLTDY